MALRKPASKSSAISDNDLDVDCLQRILSLVGNSPKVIAPTAAVCRQWRFVVDNFIWRDRCLKAAGGLCEELGYDDVNKPPGGWGGLYKLLVYCPGLYPSLDDAIRRLSEVCRHTPWWHYLGHVENTPYGFHMVTGDKVREALHLHMEFGTDKIFVSRLCNHARYFSNRENVRRHRPFVSGARGIVKNFLSSEMARVSGVRGYLEGSADAAEPMRGAVCPVCAEELFRLSKDDVFFGSGDIEGCVCTKGHLLLASPSLQQFEAGSSPISNSGQGLEIKCSGAVKFLCEHLPLASDDVKILQRGAKLLQGLHFDQVIEVGRRLSLVHSLLPLPFVARSSGIAVLPIELNSVNQVIENREVGGSQLRDAILMGQQDCQFETTRLLDAIERRRVLYVAFLKVGLSPVEAPHPESVKVYLQGGNLTMEDVMELQQANRE